MTEDFDKRSKGIEEGLSEFKKPEEPAQMASDRNAGMQAFAEIVGGLLFGLIFGYFIDDYFNTEPIFLIIFVILGLAGSVYNIYKATEK